MVTVNYALMPSEGWLQGPLVKDYLRAVVPGLDGDTSFLTCSSVDLECRVVQVGNKKTTTSPAKTTTVATTSATSSSPSLSPSTAPSAIVTSAPAVVSVQVDEPFLSPFHKFFIAAYINYKGLWFFHYFKKCNIESQPFLLPFHKFSPSF